MPPRAHAHMRLVRSSADAGLVEYLAEHRLFGVLPREALERLAAEGRHRSYPRGHHLYEEGIPTTHVYVIRSGLVAMVELDDKGAPCVVITYGADDVSGSMCATLGMTHQCTATALVDSEVLHLPKRLFDELYEAYPRLGLRVLQEVHRIVRRSRQTVMRLTLTPVSARIASFLLSVPAPEKGQPTSARLELTLSHQDIALLLGTTRESVTRVLDKLSGEGMIGVGRRRIEILDRDGLRRLIDS